MTYTEPARATTHGLPGTAVWGLLVVVAAIAASRAPSVTLPVAGTVQNTDTLLGRDGLVGVKTGSDEAAGGCFACRAIRWIGGKRTAITAVVLGNRRRPARGGPRGRCRAGRRGRRRTHDPRSPAGNPAAPPES